MSQPSSRRPRVLLLLHDLSLSGAPRMALQVFQTLAPDVEVRVLSLDEGPLGAQFRELGPTHALFALGNARLKRAAPKIEARLPGVRGAILRANGALQSRALRTWQPDLIYINSLSSLHFGRYLQLPGIPALLHVHETGSALHAHRMAMPELFASWPSRYLAVSDHTRRCLVEEGVAPEKITVAPNFLSPSTRQELSDIAAKRRPRAANQPFVIGGAGQISWTKGPELWLLMAAQLKRLMGPRVRFKWVGGRGGQEEARFEWMAHKLGLSDQLELVDATSKPFEHFATFDVLALSSWEDSFGLVVLENMALGNIVTCFAGGGGAPEIVEDAGIVVPNFNPNDMAGALAQTWENPVERAKMQRASQRRAQTFDAQKSKTAILEAISRTAQNF